MKKLLILGLVTFSLSLFAADEYKAPDLTFKSGPISKLKITKKWDKGSEFRVLEKPILKRDIASKKEEEDKTRDPASYRGRKTQKIKFIYAPWPYSNY